MINAIKEFLKLDTWPTSLSSAEISDMIRGTERKAVFSARTTLNAYVEDIQERVGSMLSGKQNAAQTAQQLQELLDDYGYTPEAGFTRGTPVPEANRGSITDLSSDARTKLVVETNYRQALNYARKVEGDTPDERYDFPAWELVRLYDRDVPRGYRIMRGQLVLDAGEDWESRWEAVGDVLTDGRMIALKDSQTWQFLGDSNVFDDGLNTDYPPFAFNSGMGWVPVSREECLSLGLVADDEQIPNRNLRRFAAELDADERTRLLADLDTEREKLLQAMET